MDQRQHLVIIKGEDKTEDVKSVFLKENIKEVTYNSGVKKYPYLENNVQVFSKPKCIAISNRSVTTGGDILTNVKEILDFQDWVKVIHTSGRTTLCAKNQFSIGEGKTTNGPSNDILGYFRKLAEVISYQQEKPVPFFSPPQFSHSQDEKYQQNRILTEWLENIFTNGAVEFKKINFLNG